MAAAINLKNLTEKAPTKLMRIAPHRHHPFQKDQPMSLCAFTSALKHRQNAAPT